MITLYHYIMVMLISTRISDPFITMVHVSTKEPRSPPPTTSCLAQLKNIVESVFVINMFFDACFIPVSYESCNSKTLKIHHCDSFASFSRVSQHLSRANFNNLHIHHYNIWSIPIAKVMCNYPICKSNIVINMQFFQSHVMRVLGHVCWYLRGMDMESITLIHDSNDLNEELVKLISMRQ